MFVVSLETRNSVNQYIHHPHLPNNPGTVELILSFIHARHLINFIESALTQGCDVLSLSRRSLGKKRQPGGPRAWTLTLGRRLLSDSLPTSTDPSAPSRAVSAPRRASCRAAMFSQDASSSTSSVSPQSCKRFSCERTPNAAVQVYKFDRSFLHSPSLVHVVKTCS